MGAIPEGVLKAMKSYREKPGDDTSKALDEAIAAADKEHEENAKKNAPPESYNLALPQGGYLTQEDLTAFAENAKKMGLSQEAAQRLWERDNEQRRVMDERMKKSASDAVKSWQAEVDKRFPDGKAKEVIGKSKAVFEIGGEKLKKFLDESGIGNQPDILEFAAIIHDKFGFGEGKIPKAGSTSGAPEINPAEVLFPKDRL